MAKIEILTNFGINDFLFGIGFGQTGPDFSPINVLELFFPRFS